MRIWRISDYADLSGRGGLLADGRWHWRGIPVVYCADHPSTAMLERLVHFDQSEGPSGYRLLAIETPESAPALRIDVEQLPLDWRESPRQTRELGTKLLARIADLLVFVPSVLVPHARNVMLNPRHPEASACRIVETVEGLFDPRLIR